MSLDVMTRMNIERSNTPAYLALAEPDFKSHEGCHAAGDRSEVDRSVIGLGPLARNPYQRRNLAKSHAEPAAGCKIFFRLMGRACGTRTVAKRLRLHLSEVSGVP